MEMTLSIVPHHCTSQGSFPKILGFHRLLNLNFLWNSALLSVKNSNHSCRILKLANKNLCYQEYFESRAKGVFELPKTKLT